MKNWILALTAASIGCAGLTSPALADASNVKTETVSYAGLNLNTIEGQRMLDQRVEIAARRVCDYGAVRTDIRLRRDAQICLIKARASARQQVAAIIEDQKRGG